MWVLVIVASIGGSSGASVPGYGSEMSCNDAGKAYISRLNESTGKAGRFICVPGPAQINNTVDWWQRQRE